MTWGRVQVRVGYSGMGLVNHTHTGPCILFFLPNTPPSGGKYPNVRSGQAPSLDEIAVPISYPTFQMKIRRKENGW